MPCVTVEVREGAVTRRVRVIAPTIGRAMEMAGAGKPGPAVRLLFPIDPKPFFVPETPHGGRRPEMGGHLERPARAERRHRPCHRHCEDRQVRITRQRRRR